MPIGKGLNRNSYGYLGLLGVTIFILALTFGLYIKIKANCDQQFIYPLDDTYIHLSMARNFANNFSYSPNQHPFVPASSSPLFTFLLSGLYKIGITGQNSAFFVQFPIIAFLLYALFLVIQLYFPHKIIPVALLFLGLSVPIPALAASGMEHLLHITILILAYYTITAHKFWLSLLLLVLLITARYESLFVVPLYLYLFYKNFGIKKTPYAIIAFGLLPTAYGIWSLIHNAPFLPISVLIKGGNPLPVPIEVFIKHYTPLFVIPILVGLLSAYLIYKKKYEMALQGLLMLFGFMGHILFARLGSFYRYEAYLIVLLTIIFLEQVYNTFTNHAFRRLFMVLALMVFCASTLLRAYGSYKLTPIASQNIYQQQYAMALFAKHYTLSGPVLVNDLGCMAYFSGRPIIDVWGLGSPDFWTSARHSELPSPAQAFKSKPALGCFYHEAMPQYIKGQKVAELYLNNNVVCAFSRSGIFVYNENDLNRARRTFANIMNSHKNIHYLIFSEKDK